MDYKDLTAILIKTAATVMLFWFLAAFPGVLTQSIVFVTNKASQPQVEGMVAWLVILYSLIPTIVGMALALFVFLFPRSVANKLIAAAPLSTQPQFIDNLQYVALRLIGLFYIYRGLVDLAFYVARIYARESEYVNYSAVVPRSWGPDDIAGIASTILEFIFALWLILGARGIIGVFDKIRGRTDDTVPPAAPAGD